MGLSPYRGTDHPKGEVSPPLFGVNEFMILSMMLQVRE